MVLPHWLAKPDMVQRDISQNLVPISEVHGICPHLLKKLESNRIQHFFPGERTTCLKSIAILTDLSSR